MSKTKIKRVRQKELPNEIWFQLYTVIKDLFEDDDAAREDDEPNEDTGRPYSPDTLGIAELFTLFLIWYDKADEALELIRKSATTEKLAEADAARDITFRGFSAAVFSAVNHFDAAKRDAARRVQVVLNHYGNLARKSYDAETAALYNILQEFTGANAGDIALLGLNDWVVQLETENKAFSALMETRYNENARKTDLRMREVRNETDRIYRQMIERIEALALINGDEAYAPFVKDLNTRLERFADIIAQRKGRNEKKKEAKDGKGETEELSMES
jgi:hypothetical protein